MKIIAAKVLDPTHLELSQPIPVQPGESIQISIPDDSEEERLWREAAKKHFLEAYDDTDDIYDDL
jgi:hypothetical protein